MLFTNNALLYRTFNLAEEVVKLQYCDESTYSYSLYIYSHALFSLRGSVMLMGHMENTQSLIPLSGQFQVKVLLFFFFNIYLFYLFSYLFLY